MPDIAPLTVQVVAQTQFTPPADVPWETDAEGGQALAEFAGRACYQSWAKPNPHTATNAGYLRHILEVGHLSVLEHGTVSMYLTGVSRSLTHELMRHRHFSLSQLSQRYVPEGDAAFVEPAAIADDPELHELFTATVESSPPGLRRPCWPGLEERFADVPNATLRRKQARQAARAVLPNATETRIVVTGNYRAWRHFVAMRASEHADVEIRELAVALPARAAAGGRQRVRRLPDQHAGRRLGGGGQPAGGRGLSQRVGTAVPAADHSWSTAATTSGSVAVASTSASTSRTAAFSACRASSSGPVSGPPAARDRATSRGTRSATTNGAAVEPR